MPSSMPIYAALVKNFPIAFSLALTLYVGLALLGGSAIGQDTLQQNGSAHSTRQESRAAINLELHQTLVKGHSGFSVGKTTDGGGPTYVFFDPQCQHCMQLWQQAKPLQNKYQLIWIPVNVLGETSLLQGAALLSSKAPVKLMNQHEQLRAQGKAGISADTPSIKIKASQDKVRANLALLKKLGYDSVPFVVRYNSEINTFSADLGSMTTAGLEDLLRP